MRRIAISTISLACLLLSSRLYAAPGMSGATGLFTVPSADTLDAGNICFGVWTVNSSYKDDYLKVRGGSANSQATIMPIALTLGVGSFWEFYASYPNLLFNTEEDASHTSKGINPAFTTPAEIGTKLRFLGKRSSDFKMAVDLFARRTVSDDPNLDGVTDTGGRLIASLRNDTLGAHIYAGYLQPGSPHNSTASYDNEILYGAGIEYLPSPRLRLSIELTGNSSRDSRFEDPLELTAGLQYHLSPHLSLNVAASKGLSDSSPDWRLIAGLTSCQGVGTYIKPIPQVGRSTARDQRIEPGKPAKIVPISSLLVRAATAPPLSKLEMPLDENGEEIIIKPYGQQLQPQVQPGTQKAVQPAQPFQPFQPVQPVQPIQPVQPVQVQPAPAVQPLPVQPAPVVQPVAPVTPVEIPAKEVAPAAPALLPQEVPLPKESAEAASVQKPLSGEAAKEQRLLVYRKFRFPDVSFEYDQFTLSKDGKQAIADVAEQIRKDKRWIYIRIDGHTDGIGSDSYNQALAIKRAMAVANQLVSVEGIDATRIYVEGFGKSKPIADNATTEGRRINRRVELLMLVPKDAPL